jgi:hypothetical protein
VVGFGLEALGFNSCEPLILKELAAYTLHTCFEDVAFLGRVKAKEHDILQISTTCLEAKLGGSKGIARSTELLKKNLFSMIPIGSILSFPT